MVKKRTLLFILILIMTGFAIQAVAAEKAGIIVPDTLYSGDEKLVLNGMGVRKKFGFKAYVAALYLPKKTTDPAVIINSDSPLTFTMNWRRVADVRKINLVFFKSFAISVNAPQEKIYTSESDYGDLSDEIVRFMSWVSKRDTQRKDVWTYRYKPGTGTQIYIYDSLKETEEYLGVIAGLEFKKALLRIWLGEKQAVGDQMKNDLLGL